MIEQIWIYKCDQCEKVLTDSINRATTVYCVEHENITFCSKECKDEWLKVPENKERLDKLNKEFWSSIDMNQFGRITIN